MIRVTRVAVLAATLVACGLAAVPAATAPTGARVPLFGVMAETVTGEAAAKEVQRLSELHAEVVRVRVTWRAAEPTQAHYDWSQYDDLLPRLRAAGIRPLLLILDAPTWARSSADACIGTTARCPPGPDHVADYANFAAAVARRYSTGELDVNPAGVEVWNEPNHPGDWQTSSGPDPARYAQLLIAAGRAIHAQAPGVAVAVGGLAGGDGDPRRRHVGLAKQLEAVYDAGGADAFDAIGVHAYTGRAPSTPVADSQAAVRRVVESATTVRDASNDSQTPIWVTETGIRDPQEVGPGYSQASLLLALYDAFTQIPAVTMVLAFRLVDVAAEPGWGLIDALYAPRQSYTQLADGMAARLPPAASDAERRAHTRARKVRAAKLQRRGRQFAG